MTQKAQVRKMANKTVEEIVAKAKSGDMAAFDLLYREYSEKLLKYVVKLGVDINDAEDIVSDSFMEAIEHIGDLKNNAFFSTWLHSIAKNKVFTMKQKEKRYARVDYSTGDGDEQNDGLDLAYAEAAEYHGDTVMLPEDYAASEEIKQILADAINSLNPDQRDAIYLFYYKNRSVSEIARQTGVNENTVKSRLSLARKYMERKLKDLQKSGVMLCAVPISSIIGQLDSEAKISAGGAPALASAASGKAIAAAVTAIVVGTTSAMFYFGRERGQLRGDERLPDSFVVESIDDSSIVTTSWTTTTTIPETTQETSENTGRVTTTARTTTTAASAVPAGTVPVQTAQPGNDDYVPEVYDENYNEPNNNEQPDNTVSNEDSGSAESITDDSSETGNESSQFAIDYWYADPYDIEPSGISVSGINKKIYDIGSIIEVVIPSEINGNKVITIERGPFADLDAGDDAELAEYNESPYASFGMCPNLRSVTIENGIREIGTGAFMNCVSLESINIPYGVNRIGDAAFCECWNIKALDIPSSVTVIENGAFIGCKSIKELNIPSGCTEISDSLCWGCENLTDVSIPEGVTKIGDHAFFDCYSLKSITIPKSVEEIGGSALGKYNEPSDVSFKFTIYCYKDSAAHKYAIDNELNFELLD